MPADSQANRYLIKKKISGDFVSANTAEPAVLADTHVEAAVTQTHNVDPVSAVSDWQREAFDARELLSMRGEEFIDSTYRHILKRPPDPSGKRHYLKFLETGGRARSVIEALRYSIEGEKIGTRVSGIRPKILYKLLSAPAMRLRMILVR